MPMSLYIRKRILIVRIKINHIEFISLLSLINYGINYIFIISIYNNKNNKFIITKITKFNFL